MRKVRKSDEQWREELTPTQYKIMREKGTEPAFTGAYVHDDSTGTYHCAACGLELFASESKYDSGSGWPSFSDVIESEHVLTLEDFSGGMSRIEIRCARCEAHLGHVFPDGPQPTGLRYCVNSAALNLRQQATSNQGQ